MSTSISGGSSSVSQSVLNGMLSTKSSGVLGSASNTTKSSTKKKALNYNHRALSGQIMRAKSPQSASAAVTRAKSKLAVLQRAASSGQYDSKEVANAIAHVRRMVRAAQLKVRNLKTEEREAETKGKKSSAEVAQKRSTIKRRAAQKERNLKSEAKRQSIEQVQTEKQRNIQMAQKRRAHRNQEQGEILDADMKFLKQEIADGRIPCGYTSSDSGVILELSAQSTELAMTQEQIEAQIEAELDAELAATGFETGLSDAAVVTADSGVSGAGMSQTVDSAAVGASVDVSV